MTKCTVCPPGKSINRVGAASCDVCAIGKFSNTTMITKCADCQLGLFQSKRFGQPGFISDCISCDHPKAFPDLGMVPNPGKTELMFMGVGVYERKDMDHWTIHFFRYSHCRSQLGWSTRQPSFESLFA